MKRILILSLTPFFGGGEVYLHALASFLKRQDYHVVVYCKNSQLSNKLQSAGILVHCIKASRYPIINYIIHFFKLLKIMRDENIHWVHLNGNRELFFAPLFRLKKLIITATKHTYPYPQYHINRLGNMVLAFCIKMTRKTICVSCSLRDRLISLGVNASLIVAIQNAPHRRYLEGVSVEIDHAGLAIVMLARISVFKGVRELCEACCTLPDVSLTFVGDGDQGLIDSYKKKCQVRCVGYLDDPLLELAKADVVALPSHAEGGCPLALLEGMAMGKPVIATHIPSIRELVRNGTDGFLVDVGDVSGLRDKISRLKNDKALRLKMGQSARQRILDLYSPDDWEFNNKRFFSDVYEGVGDT